MMLVNVINYHKMVENQFRKRIKMIRSDNGGEFISYSMISFHNQHRILFETNCPQTPQQNRVVEPKHKHLLEIDRALKFEEKIPKTFWVEFISTAAYVTKRLSSKTPSNKTPYEVLLNHKPDYNYMRPFGCRPYYRQNATKGHKFKVKERRGVFF